MPEKMYSINRDVSADTEKSLTKIALCVEYDGHLYSGWQRQKHSKSVQGVLETVLSGIANQPIELHCAGRTDSGVHATGQIVHFNFNNNEGCQRQLKAWVEGSNARLPDDISVRWATEVSNDFHARFSATARTYRYIIHNSRSRSALLSNRVARVSSKLDIKAIQSCLGHFLGEQDFSTVRAANCQSNSCFRNIHRLEASQKGEFILIEICANAFLYHMVRNIAGILIAVGKQQLSSAQVLQLLENKDRTQAPATAPASGLYLVDVLYPEKFELPHVVSGPWPWQLQQRDNLEERV